mmetsp:Transcript_64160/g.126775  ORF Transcript_64160/g.126775 Transcript_64160/m.126775 type:complete len:282 (+) Transcript_64160:622-1467(+)
MPTCRRRAKSTTTKRPQCLSWSSRRARRWLVATSTGSLRATTRSSTQRWASWRASSRRRLLMTQSGRQRQAKARKGRRAYASLLSSRCRAPCTRPFQDATSTGRARSRQSTIWCWRATGLRKSTSARWRVRCSEASWQLRSSSTRRWATRRGHSRRSGPRSSPPQLRTSRSRRRSLKARARLPSVAVRCSPTQGESSSVRWTLPNLRTGGMLQAPNASWRPPELVGSTIDSLEDVGRLQSHLATSMLCSRPLAPTHCSPGQFSVATVSLRALIVLCKSVHA